MHKETSLGGRVRSLRIAAGKSQAELAGPGLSASYVSLIESGRRTPTAAAVEMLAEALGTSDSYLLTGIDERPPHEISLRLGEAEMALRNGDPHVALDLYLRLTGELNPVADRRQWRSATSGLARSHERLGDLTSATQRLEGLRADSGPGDVEPTWVAVLVDLVRCYREAGDRNLAERIAEEALAAFDRLGNPGGAEEVTLANTLIGTYFETGDWLRASNLAETTLARAEASGDLQARATSYWSASQLAQASGEPGLALDYSQRALALFAESDKDRNTAMMTVHRAWILLAQDGANAAAALDLLAPVLASLERVGDDLPLAYCRLEVARAHVHLGNRGEAGVLAELAGETFKLAGNVDGLVSALTVRAQADSSAALVLLEEATELLRGTRPGRAQAELWVSIAQTLRGLGQLESALEAYGQATRSAGVSVPQVLTRTNTLT